MIAKLNTAKKQIQQRFNPPASAIFNHDDVPANGRPQKGMSSLNSGGFNASSFPGPISFVTYEYEPPEYLDDKPTSKPMISVPKYRPVPTNDKVYVS